MKFLLGPHKNIFLCVHQKSGLTAFNFGLSIALSIKRGLTPRQPAAVQGGLPPGKCGLQGNNSVGLLWITIGGFFMSKNIYSLDRHPKFLKGSRRGRQRLFDMGRHWYSGGPGSSWVTNYWIKKISRATEWELYCSQETSLSRREYCGTFSAEQLRDYFEEVGFELEEDHWREIGVGRTASIHEFERKLKKWSRCLS